MVRETATAVAFVPRDAEHCVGARQVRGYAAQPAAAQPTRPVDDGLEPAPGECDVETERESDERVIDVTPEEPIAAELVRETPRALARPATGGVVVYATVAGAASVVPVPFVDAFLAKLARGSAMRRVAARRGVRLTPEGRAVLARPGLAAPLGTAPARLLRSAITRALAPVRIASRIEDATATFLSALLLDHYLATSDRRPGAPLGDREAMVVRAAMEQAWADSGLEALRTVPVGIVELVAHAVKAAFALDTEGRGPVERFVDALLDGAADAPEDFVQRMRDHFDAALAARSGELTR